MSEHGLRDFPLKHYADGNLERLDELTRQALADVDAGRVVDHWTVREWKFKCRSSSALAKQLLRASRVQNRLV